MSRFSACGSQSFSALLQGPRERKERKDAFLPMHPLIQQATTHHRNLLEPEAWEVLNAYGIETPPFRWARSPREAKQLATHFPFPQVLKVVSPDILHKTEVGGVVLGLRDENEVEAAFEAMEQKIRRTLPEADLRGALLCPQMQPGRELILGKVEDPQIGSVLMLGLGGIFAELLRDVVFRKTPLSAFDAKEMIGDLKFHDVFKGVRGSGPLDLEALVRTLLAFSRLVEENPAIKECDLNPILLYEKGLCAVDARMLLSFSE